MKKYTGDFETAVWLEDETWVWAWALCNIDSEKIEIGNDIEGYIEFLKNEKNPTVYMHNLKFDR